MSDVAKVFDKVSPGYDDWYSQPKGKQVFEAESRAVESMLPSEGVGLEIGAGTGKFADEFTTSNRTVICLDLSVGMLLKARERCLHTLLGDATRLPFREGSLDFAYLVTVIEFLRDPVVVLEGIKDVLKNGAPIVALIINRDSEWGELYLKMAKNNDLVFS